MSTTVKTGWLKDKNGDKFAPKTLTSQVQTSDGTLIEDKIQTDIDAAKEELAPLVGTTAEITPAQVAEAVASGRPVAITHTQAPFGSIQYCYFNVSEAMGLILSTGIVEYYGGKITIELYGSIASGEWDLISGSVAEKDDIPDAVVNPASASVGQTIVVDEVNANGKPSKWKAADHQERTHGSKWVELLPETTLTFTNSQYQGDCGISFEAGKTYKIVWNGVEYICEASYFNFGTIAGNGLGNQAGIGGTDTGEPFMIGTIADSTALLCIELTGATSATVSFSSEEITTIPPKYLPDSVGYDDSEVILPETSVYIDRLDGGVVDIGIDLNETYIVIWDGVPYTCKSFIYENFVCLGNFPHITGVDSGEPFQLASLSNKTVVYHYYNLDTTTTRVSLSIIKDGLHKIPEKYLPDGIGYDNSETVLPLTDLRYVDDGIDKYFVVDVPQLPLIEGDVYDVNYNGVLYQCTAKVPEGSDVKVLGNLDIVGSGAATDEPFLIFNSPSMSKVFLYTNEVYGNQGITKAILSIVHNALHKIPEKYLPDIVKTASVGQTLIVKEVDENGKPTKWESADYQSRTHWEEEKAIITDAPIIRNEEIDMVGFNADVEFVPGYYYTATYNGEKHTALCRRHTFEDETVVFVGNGGVYGLEDTGESFFMTYFPDDGFVVFFTVDAMNGEAEMPTSVSVAEKVFVQIPEKYIPKNYFEIDVTDEHKSSTGNSYKLTYDTTELVDAIAQGKQIYINVSLRDTNGDLYCYRAQAIDIQVGNGRGNDIYEYIDAWRSAGEDLSTMPILIMALQLITNVVAVLPVYINVSD